MDAADLHLRKSDPVREITAQPGFTDADVMAVMASSQFVYAECYTIAPLQGPVMRFTDAQQDVSVVAAFDVNRYTYFSKQIVITGLRARSTIGVEVDEQTVNLAYSDDHLFQTYLSWPQALRLGRLDGATITRDRFVAQSWDSPWVGGFRMFSGRVSTLNAVGRSYAEVMVKSDLERLNKPMPRDLYTPVCKNVWGDERCGVDQSTHAVISVISAGPSTRTIIPWSSSDPYFGLGKFHITNTDNVTRIRTILRATATHLYLIYPLDFDPVAGMEFTAFPGCSRAFTGADGLRGCEDYHAEPEDHFGGHPFVPVAETAA